MKIRTVTRVFVVAVFSVFTFLSMSLVKISDLLDSSANEFAKAGESIRIAEELKARLLLHNRDAFLFSLQKDKERLEVRNISRVEIASLLSTMRGLVNNFEEQNVLDALEDEIALYLDKRTRLEELKQSPIDEYITISKDVDHAVTAVNKLVSVNHYQMTELVRTIDQQSALANKIGATLFICGGLLLLTLMVLMIWYVSLPLQSFSKVISRYSKGELNSRTVPVGLEEIKDIGTNFNTMADVIAQRQKDQLRFVASIAHDIRNPLNSMFMASEILVERESAENKEIAGIIHRQVRNLDRLVGDLMDTTRIESGQLDLNLSKQNICTLVHEAVQLHRTGSDLHSIRLNAPAFLGCHCDPNRISQVLNNLISNAIKYSPNGGVITIEVNDKSEFVEITVADQGIGIEQKDIDNIFKPFHRTESTKSTIPGIGLGLSASRRIVESHRGTLTVTSEPHKGSVFKITLPAAQGLNPSHQPAAPTPQL